MPSVSATTAAARRQAASASGSIAASTGPGTPPPCADSARGSSGQGSRISNRKGVPRRRRASSAGSATVSGVDDATTRSHDARSASRDVAAA